MGLLLFDTAMLETAIVLLIMQLVILSMMLVVAPLGAVAAAQQMLQSICCVSQTVVVSCVFVALSYVTYSQLEVFMCQNVLLLVLNF